MRLGLKSMLAMVLFASSAAAAETPRVVVDMAGQAVTVPAKIERVACLEVLCYQKMAMLGAADRVMEMVRNGAPWMAVTNPHWDRIATTVGEPNLEDLLARRADVVFFAYDPARMRLKLTALGLPALVSQPVGRRADTASEFLEQSKATIRMFGQVLGGEAMGRAEEWCATLDAKVRMVGDRIRAIPADRRPKLYYVRGPQALDTQGVGSSTYWFGQLAGAHMVIGDADLALKGTVSQEEILRWDPDVVLVGRQYPLDLVLGDARWANVSAVKSHRVYASPEGVFYWDGGPEGVLLMEFIAKRLYPDLFRDLDMAAEVKDYYARFYRTRLDEDQVDKLLRGLSPDGSRANRWNT